METRSRMSSSIASTGPNLITTARRASFAVMPARMLSSMCSWKVRFDLRAQLPRARHCAAVR
jgi:hypothetical protein